MSTSKSRPSFGGTHSTPEVPVGITVTGLPNRSTNLERDVRAAEFPDLYVGARTQEVLDRLISAIEDPQRTRAWSLTGPYGSGKSTLGLIIDALLAPAGSRHGRAMELLHEANGTLAERLLGARKITSPTGFLGAVVTARREPLVSTLIRALHVAVTRRWARKIPNAVKTVMQGLEHGGSAEILCAVQMLCQHGPLLLVIDEFGKTLEHLAVQAGSSDNADDLYLLQELAELGAGTSGLPLYMFTLQHLSFLDYAARTTTLQTREWAKIQGRFEDIAFTTHPGDTLQLLVRSLDHDGLNPTGVALVEQQSQAAERLWPDLGLQGVLPADRVLLTRLYPLHPLTALAAPLLAAQVGQNDRSLSGFLTGDEPHTVHRFLATHASANAQRASTVRLSHLYNYFLASGRTTVLASANASRWIEIDVRLSEAHALPAEDMEILKTVGLLNLIDSSGALRASADMILFALNDPADASNSNYRRALLKRLDTLTRKGFLVYREFSDEYRVWQGTDTDIKARVEELREQCDDAVVADLVATRVPVAVVAGRHSQHTGLLRHFVTAVSTTGNPSLTGPSIGDPADGLLLYHLGPPDTVPAITSGLPAVVGTTAGFREVVDAGRQLWALQELLLDPVLDSVARREVSERSLQAAAHLAQALAAAFSPGNPDTNWTLLRCPPDSDMLRPDPAPLKARSLAGVVSVACDISYDQCPTVHNEMLGRHQLTSQGAKARRELLTAMIEHPAQKYLAIDGYGPERAMYSGVLAPLGLHEAISRDGDESDTEAQYRFCPPDPGTSLHPAWTELEGRLTGATEQTSLADIISSLVAPPFGIKSGVVPLVVVTALLLRNEDLAIFEDGTYTPAISAEIVERLVKAPSRFTVKAIPNSQGQRKALLSHLDELLEIQDGNLAHPEVRRNSALLSVTRALLEKARTLTSYTVRTTQISPSAVAVREALLTTTDPDHLLFTALPVAVGHPPVPASARTRQQTARECALAIVDAVSELTAFQQAQRSQVVSTIGQAFRLSAATGELRRDFRARVRGLQDVLIAPDLKGLVRHVLSEGTSDDEWLDPLIIRICGAAIGNWTDAQAQHFPRQAKEMARSLDRVTYLRQGVTLDDDAEGFRAQLVTVTSPDGAEERALVNIPDHLSNEASIFAARCLEQAHETLGADGARILLASLARTLLLDETPHTSEDLLKVESSPLRQKTVHP